MTKYTATAIGDGTRLRPDHNTNNTYIGSYSKGTNFHGEQLFVADKNLFSGLNQYQAIGDKWLLVTDINGTPKSGWVSVINMGQAICTLVDNSVEPPPPDPTPVPGDVATIEILAAPGTVINAKDATGKVIWTGTAK